ncbi:MAG TPA: glycoside hydrolase family 2 TIM barrel-domain containing protein [Pirellulaceae bacterium]|nr:glycoside hydrolase family 2 TIM barrel-domain containing protein [Pirellulaceae bacterium]
MRSFAPPASLLLALVPLFAARLAAQEPTAPAPSSPSPVPRLVTRFAADVDPAAVLPEYPRPTLVRSRWLNLNGPWDYAIRPADETTPETFDGSILVPFPVESHLSGVARTIAPTEALWYRRTITIPSEWSGERIRLNFGAVDWSCDVLVDGTSVGSHQGGYDPFSLDITDKLREPIAGEHELIVKVLDPTDAGPQPRGKQVAKPGGIWYTPVSGIWQTVWIEPVADAAIDRLVIEPDPTTGTVRIAAELTDPALAASTELVASIDGTDLSGTATADGSVELRLPSIRWWSPEDPHLYETTIELRRDGQVVDSVRSYFGMRTIEVRPDANGIPRLWLNGEVRFLFGPLDQGWWPDGLYTAPTDEALRYDLEVTRRAGFNLVRKHVKVEPELWYAHCDRMGLIVWQDMPSGEENARWPLDGTELTDDRPGAAIFERELTAMIRARRHHPCIVAWVPFNEAWGQFRTAHWTEVVKRLDPTRLVISASGGNDFGTGDIHDIHNYPGPEAPPAERRRAAVLGEYGGLGLPLAGHTWQDEANWGYRSYESPEALQEAYLKYIAELRPMIESRLAAAVYTQTTDVEVETNGLMTYDRAVVKFDLERLAEAHATLYEPIRTLDRRERSFASTVAYWRFEEGTPGELVPHDRNRKEAIAARDVSGHDNHLYAYSEANAPRSTDDVPAAIVPLTGEPNRGALDDREIADGATRDLYTNPGRSETHMDVIETFAFDEFTIELSVNVNEASRIGVLLGEDGRPNPNRPEAPLRVGIDDAGCLVVQVVDRQREVRTIRSIEPLATDLWHHLAIRCDGKRMTVDRLVDGRCVPIGASDCVGGMVLNVGVWTIGRGFAQDRVGLDGRALLDEIRISAIALDDDLLLWSEE